LLNLSLLEILIIHTLVTMRFISPKTHAFFDFAIGLLIILTPNIFGFSDAGNAAVMVPRIVGILLILDGLITDNGLNIACYISMRRHLTADLILGLFLMASPWLFGFHDKGASAWLPHLLIGLIVVAASLATHDELDRPSTGRHAAAH